MLKSVKTYSMALAASIVIFFTGIGCFLGMFGPIAKREKIYEEYEKTPAYTEYYQSNVKYYLEEFNKGTITEKEYKRFVKNLSAKDCIKQKPIEEKIEIEREIEALDDQSAYICMSGALLMGVGMAGVAVVEAVERKNDEDEFEIDE